MTENENQIYWDEGKPKGSVNQSGYKKIEFKPSNYLNTRLADGEKTRTTRIRVILTKDNDGKLKVAIPVEVHSLKLNENQNRMGRVSKSEFKSFICLNDSHVDNDGKMECPLCAKKSEIFDEANKISDPMERKAMCKKAYSYDSKTAYIVRCIERGHEDEGVKFWRFNKRDDGAGIFDELMAMYMTYRYPTDKNGNEYFVYDSNGEREVNPEYIMPSDGEWEDIFDYVNGRDIKIVMTQSLTKSEKAPKKTAVKLVVETKQSPLSQDPEQAEAWINDEKDWRDMYRVKSYDFLKIIADDKTPVFDRNLGKFVPFVGKDETDSENPENELKYDLPEIPDPYGDVAESDEELPF